MNPRGLIAIGLLAALAGRLPPARAAETHHALRGYREFTELAAPAAEANAPVQVRSFVFDDSEHAAIFASKIYSDYTLTFGNTLTPLATGQGPVDALSLGGHDLIVPLVERGGKRVDVLIGADAAAVTARANELLHAPPQRAAEMTHPEFMDKWDRYCLGVWNRFDDVAGDPTHKTPESYYGWLAQIGVNPQLVNASTSQDLTANDNLLRMVRKYFAAAGTKYQNVEWLQAYPELYNRNPFLSSFDGPGMMTPWSYYGETPHAPGLLRDVQHAPILKELRDYTRDNGLMAILDADGEVGPFPYFKWGEYGPVQTRNFVRYLKEVRHFSLADVSRRYYGNADALKSWDDVTLADWRTFYGWNDSSVDLQGEWRVMSEGDSPGVREGWQSPAFNDSDWIRLSYPGDTTLFTLIDGANPRPLWMRRTMTVDTSKFPGPIYLTVAPLCNQPVQVFVDGKRLGILAPRFFTAHIFGQFDVTQLVRANPTLTVALRFESNDMPNGPVFLTSKPLPDFPTDDPLLNARRYDHFDFIDWAVADSVGSMLKQDRAIDPDRPIKVHAYESSAWGWKMIGQLGGYSHHTGAGAGWTYTVPKQYALARNLQDSAETGGSMETPRNIKGLFGCLIFMGKNAHDYFYNLQDITKDPAVLDWFVKKLPDIRLMGRENVDASPVASIRGLRNTHYLGEFSRTVEWRFSYDGMVKGGEMKPLLDELRIGEGHLPYPAIVDEGTLVWDSAMTAALRQYVQQGGILFLEAASGLDTPEVRNAGPGPTLAGVKITGDLAGRVSIAMTVADPILGNRTGDVGPAEPHAMSPAHQISVLPGTDIIATTTNGAPAITRRKIGGGAVYYCVGGQWPGALRDAICDRFAPPVYATKEGDGVDLLRTARSNNGCEDLLMLRGLGRPATIHWTFDYTPAAIYNPVTGAPIPATITGHTATFQVNIDDWDFAWFAARRPDAREQFAHWLQRQDEMWAGLVKGSPAPNPPLFRSLDLNRGWKLVQTTSAADAQSRMKLDDPAAGLVPADLGWWNAPGTGLRHGPGVFGLYRRDFTLPAGWEKNATLALNIDGRVYNWPQAGFGGPSTIYLNGTQIWTGEKLNDAVSLELPGIKPGSNRIEIVHEGEGVLASIQLVRTITPDATLDLSGDWNAVDGLQSVRTVQLPGKIKTAFVYRDVVVPKEQSGREVWLRVTTGDVGSSAFVIVNGRNRYPVTRADNSRPMEVNITPEVRFGEPNRILLASGSMNNGGWKAGLHDYQKLELGFYAPGRWTGDGRGIEAALTPRELAAVAKQEARVQLFPLVQDPVTKPPVNLFSFSASDAQAYAPPAPAVDLDLASANVSDRGSAHVPVQVVGKIVPFQERGGAVKGLEFLGEGDTAANLVLPEDAMVKILNAPAFTMCAWLKPMLDRQTEATLTQWGLAWDWDITDRGTSIIWNDNAAQQLAAGDIVSQRQWHFLAVSVAGKHATLYVDGVNVADQTWNDVLGDGRTPFMIGGNARFSHFLRMKLASFTIYPQALDDDSVGKLFVKDRDRFAGAPDAVWPEDYLCRLAFAADGVKDMTDLPATIVCGPGTTPKMVDGRAILDFDGQNSSLLVDENPRIHLLGSPYSLIMDINPAVGAEGTLLRRLFNPSLTFRKDGTIVFDNHSGENNYLEIPHGLVPGQWNRLMLTYDGKTFSLFRDGTLIVRKDYPGDFDANWDHPMSIGADNTVGTPPFANRVAMQLREFAIFPRVLDAMPPSPPKNPSSP